MEKEPKIVIYSTQFKEDIIAVYTYGYDTFGKVQAEIYQAEIYKLVATLNHSFELFSECRYLPTKSKMYRWIILDSHLIIYRITDSEVQVLRIINSHRSISKIKGSRGIRT